MEITKEQKKKIDKIAKKYGLELLLLFGSAAAGTMRKDSDYDVAYFSKKPLNLIDEAKLITDLFPVFRSDKVDLASIRNASPLLFYAIFQDCQILFEKTRMFFDRMRVYAFKKYIETKPLYEYKFQRLQEKIDKIKL